jgi:hypothetical protein
MKNLLVLSIMIITFMSTKAQCGLAETSIGYSPALKSITFIMKVGIMSDDYSENDAQGVYAKMNYNLTRKVNIPQIIGLHYLYNLNGFRLNVGADYHLNVVNTGWKLSYGVSKYFLYKPIVISADMSGKYFTASIGLFATL